MSQNTGNSIVGNQSVLVSQPAASIRWSLKITNSTTFPPQLRGYYTLILFNLVLSPQELLVVDRGKIFSPGTFRKIPSPDLGANWFYRLDVQWNQSNLPWVAIMT